MRFNGTLMSSILISTLALGAAPALAQEAKRTEVTDMTAAISRDLGLSAEQVKALGPQQERAIALDEQLQKDLGEQIAGTHFDLKSGKLIVSVTDRSLLDKIKAAGGEPRLVRNSLKQLTEIKNSIEGGGVPGGEKREILKSQSAFSAIALDPVSNTVKLTATREQAKAASELAAKYGEAVSVEMTDSAPEPTINFLDGGDGYNGNNCSTGFNLRNPSTGAKYMLTAGHCLNDGQIVNGHDGTFFGTTLESWFPTYDDALVRNQNTGYWFQGPWFDSNPSNGAFHSFSGMTDAPVGTIVCKAGIKTKFTCGTITIKNEDVTYSSGDTVYNMTRHSACVEPGDSGGSNLSYIGGKFRAEGVTSGARMRRDAAGVRRCLSKFGEKNVSWYFPVVDSMIYYGPKYGVTLW
jgi:streptogrisin C